VQTLAREDEDDVPILRRVARGERDALGELYDRHAGRLLALGLRILGNPRESEDVTHDVFLEAWRTAGDYDPARGSVRVWLLVRMRSRCLDRLRSHAYARSVPIEGHEPSEVRDTMDHEGSAERALDGARLAELLSELPAPQRAVLELGYFRGLSFQEIADELQIPVGTVKSRASAAMATLRRELGVSRGGNAA
jgi:RNA polymerase sigma-70 factor, ECF subfamily